jgi:dihydrofolate reductase
VIRSGLIDEYRLIMHPVVLGSGLPIFADVAAPIRFKLANETTFKTGIIAMELRPA